MNKRLFYISYTQLSFNVPICPCYYYGYYYSFLLKKKKKKSLTNKSIYFVLFYIRNRKQEANLLKAERNHCNHYQARVRQCYQDRRTDGMGGFKSWIGGEPGAEGLCQCIHVHIWAYGIKLGRKWLLKWACQKKHRSTKFVRKLCIFWNLRFMTLITEKSD